MSEELEAEVSLSQKEHVARDILEFFPKPSFYPGQKEALQEIDAHFQSGKKIVILEGPTGSGKSACAVALARKYGGYMLTSQKLLQTQYENDFPELGVLRGRNAYLCSVTDGYADVAPCVVKKRRAEVRCSLDPDGEKRTRTVGCFYANAIEVATRADIKLMNYHVHHAHRNTSRPPIPGEEPEFDEKGEPTRYLRFGMGGLVLGDEAHGLEQLAMGMIDLTLDESDIPLEPEDTVEGLMKKLLPGGVYLVGLARKSSDLAMEISCSPPGKDRDKKIRQGLHLDSLLKRIYGLCASYMRAKKDEEAGELPFENRWLLKIECAVGSRTPHKISLKPVFAGKFVPSLFFNKGRRVLLMSATILNKDVFCETIGVPAKEAAFVSIPCHFPVKNRLVHVYGCGDLSYRSYNSDIGRVIEGVRRVLEIHKGQRGIIHTQSWRVTKDIVDALRDPRLIVQVKGTRNREDYVEALRRSKDGVLVAPAMHEGLDLKEELSRFQVIAKIPWPDFNDPQIKARAMLDDKWYLWCTALKFVQSAGRSIRSATDYAATYVLDSSFYKFHQRCSQHKGTFLPPWFIDALRLYDIEEVRSFLAGKSEPCQE